MAILFAQDWARYPSAIIDAKTKNQSFLRLAAVYRSMGIRNHAFILALHDPTLQGVDPYSKDLTQEQMMRIAVECSENPWYWMREVVRAPAIGGSEPTQFEANRGNIALYWLFYNHITQFLIQPRQTGKSFSTDTLMVQLLLLVCKNTKMILMTANDGLRRKNVQRLKEIMDDLPRYLDPRNREDAANFEEITVNARGNFYSTMVPKMSPKQADTMGRGFTTSIMHIDEGPFQPNISVALKAGLPAMGAAADKSKAQGAPYGVIYTTTAGKKDDKDGKYVYNLLQDGATWDEKFFDCTNQASLEQLVRRSSRGGALRVACIFNHRQLGKSDNWMRRKLEEATVSGEEANRDFFNMWTAGNAAHPLPLHILEQITGSLKEVDHLQIDPVGPYTTRWYIPEDEVDRRLYNGHYILGMDTSEAGGGDDISMVLYDAVTLEVIAAGHYNETNLITFADWVAGWFIRYKNITGIIERRSTGGMIIDNLLIKLPAAGIDPFRRLFNMIVHNAYDPRYEERFKEISVPMSRRDPSLLVRYKTEFGYTTSGSGQTSRSALYSTTLQAAAKQAGWKVHDKKLIDQLAGLVIRNGRVDHEKGEHDDMVIGWLLTNWFLMQGQNLSFYGIDPRIIMSEVEADVYLEPAEAAHIQEQNHYRQQLEELTKRLAAERDDYICMKLEQEMRVLMSRIVFQESEVYAVDELIRQAKESRRNKFRYKAAGALPTAVPNAYATSGPDYRPMSMSGYSDTPMNLYHHYH